MREQERSVLISARTHIAQLIVVTADYRTAHGGDFEIAEADLVVGRALSINSALHRISLYQIIIQRSQPGSAAFAGHYA